MNILKASKDTYKQTGFDNKDHACYGILKICMPISENVVVTFEANIALIEVSTVVGA